MGTIEAVRKATDPYGIEGTSTAAARPSASEIVERLRQLGFKVVRSIDPVCRTCGQAYEENPDHFAHIGVMHTFEVWT